MCRSTSSTSRCRRCRTGRSARPRGPPCLVRARPCAPPCSPPPRGAALSGLAAWSMQPAGCACGMLKLRPAPLAQRIEGRKDTCVLCPAVHGVRAAAGQPMRCGAGCLRRVCTPAQGPQAVAHQARTRLPGRLGRRARRAGLVKGPAVRAGAAARCELAMLGFELVFCLALPCALLWRVERRARAAFASSCKATD